MAKKIYVGNLSFETTDADLNDMFSQVGQVESAQIIRDRDTGRSKGFGFVEMSDDACCGQSDRTVQREGSQWTGSHG